MQLAGGQNHPFTHSAIAHHAERFVALATIGVAATASVALQAIEVGLNGTTVAWFDVRDALADLNHLDSQFVSGNAGITEERHLAEVATDVRAANPDAMNTDERLVWPGRRRIREVDGTEALRFFEKNGFHALGLVCP